MARPLKDGVDYFPKDTGFYIDDKVRLLRAEFGTKGMYLLDYILCDLYGKNGYFMLWDKNKCYLVSDGAGCGCDPSFVAEFISGCIRCSFFDERVFKMFGVLTSAGIQRRYVRMFKGRETIQIIEEYFLLDIGNSNDVPKGVLEKLTFKHLKSTENPDKSTENTQSKVKKSKVKKSKEDNISLDIPAELSESWNAFLEMRKQIKKPMTDNAKSLAYAKLMKLSNGNLQIANAILQESVINSWQGLFPLKEVNQYGSSKPQGASGTSKYRYGETLG